MLNYKHRVLILNQMCIILQKKFREKRQVFLKAQLVKKLKLKKKISANF